MARQGVGARLKRKEDDRHLRGRAQFVSDLDIPGTLHVAFVRSPHAHGRLKGVMAPAGAEERVFSAADFPDLLPLRAEPEVPGFKASGYPPLATEKVRFVGEAVAMCVAPTLAEAEDIAAAVRLDIEVLPPVVDAQTALDDGMPLLHEGWDNNAFIEMSFEGGAISPPAAIANAVRDALAHLGAEVNETPLTPARVRAAIEAAERSEAET